MPTLFEKKTYVARRNRLKKQVGNGIILFLGNKESSINYEANYYRFRQDSTFLYFFGLDKPDLHAIIDVDRDKEILFGDEVTMDEIIWTGSVEPLADYAAKVGIQEIKPSKALREFIKQSISENAQVHFLPPYRPEHRQQLSLWFDKPMAVIEEFVSDIFIKSVVEQRSVKSEEEVHEIEKAVNTTVDMQINAAQLCREGATETAITSMLFGIASSNGGTLSFPSIVTVNGQVLHNQPQSNILKKGQMLLCDCGAETQMHYAGDLTRTFPVGDSFSGKQRLIYDIVLHAHEAAIQSLRPGIKFKDVHLLACTKLAEGLKEVGLMKGNIDDAVAEGAHEMFFQCGLGHMMGLDTHDMENLGKKYLFGYSDQLTKSPLFGIKALRLGKALENGYVLTIEPGIYFIPELIERWKAEDKFVDFINYQELEKFKNFGGVRIEEDLIITGSGSRILGKSLFRDAAGMESLKNG